MKRKVMATLLMAGLIGHSQPGWTEDDEGVRKPPTRQTQSISAGVFKDLDVAQQAFDAKDYAGALAALDRVRAREDQINDYERATLHNLYAVIHYAEARTDKAIEHYLLVLQQPNLPEGLRDATLFALAQMYFVTEDYPRAVQVLNKWFSLTADPAPDAYMLLAQAYYQQQRYADAETPILTGLKRARDKGVELRENWLGLLRAVYYELDEIPKAAKVLEILVTRFPSESYYLQLSGMYGLMGNQTAQMATLHAAYLGGMLSKASDQLNLARLYLVEGAPFPAIQLLSTGFRDQRIEVDADNLQLYAQALSFAREYEAQVPVLKKLAGMTNEAEHYLYLGQALNELGRWDEAIEAFEGALNGEALDDIAAVRMQLGTAQFNAGQLRAALRTFISLQNDDAIGTAAANWVKFVSAEIERQKVLDSTG